MVSTSFNVGGGLSKLFIDLVNEWVRGVHLVKSGDGSLLEGPAVYILSINRRIFKLKTTSCISNIASTPRSYLDRIPLFAQFPDS